MSNIAAEQKEKAAHKAPDVARETDGRDQLVPYPGWLRIAERIEKKKGRPAA